jgi:hypothetical protein
MRRSDHTQGYSDARLAIGERATGRMRPTRRTGEHYEPLEDLGAHQARKGE